MKTNLINNTKFSFGELPKENYKTFIAGAFRGTQYYQYEYQHTN